MANLSGQVIRVCAETWIPWITVETGSTGELTVKGPMASILHCLSSTLKFRFEILQPSDGQWGMRKADGHWTGMVGMVQKNICDLILGPLAVTFERSSVVTFTSPPIVTFLAILGGHLHASTTNIFGYFAVFNWQVWCLVLVSMILLSLLTSSTGILLHSVDQNSAMKDFLPQFVNRTSRLLYEYLGTLLCESSPRTPVYHSLRIALGFWWIAVIVLMNTFTGQLKASMLLQPHMDRIENMDDLAAKKSVLPLVWKGTAYEALVKESENPSFVKIWSRIKKQNGTRFLRELYSPENMVAVQQSKNVIVSDLQTLKYAMSEHCRRLSGGEFYISRENFFGHSLGLAVGKNFSSKQLKRINTRIRWLVESELVNRWMEKKYENLSKCPSSGAVSDSKMLAMKDLMAVFQLWLILLAASLLALLVELAVFKWKKLVFRHKWRKVFRKRSSSYRKHKMLKRK